MIWEKDYSLIR